MPFPAKPDGVTAGWLAAAFGVSPSALRDFAVEPLGTERGILGELTRVSLDWAAGSQHPSSVVLKVARRDFQRELRFYRELAGDCGVSTPGVYASQVDPETGQYALLLEDLGDCQLYGPGEASLEIVRQIAVSAARMHALWWARPELRAMPWLLTPEEGTAMIPGRVRPALPLARDWYERNASPEMFRLAERMPEAVERGLFLPAGPRTFIHGDLGVKNVAVRPTGEIVVFDWQMCGASSPGWELAELVKDSYGPLSVVEMAAFVLNVYHEGLCDLGVRDLSFAALESAFGVACTRSLFVPAVLASGPLDPAREDLCRRWTAVATALMDRFDFEGLIDHACRD